MLIFWLSSLRFYFRINSIRKLKATIKIEESDGSALNDYNLLWLKSSKVQFLVVLAIEPTWISMKFGPLNSRLDPIWSWTNIFRTQSGPDRVSTQKWSKSYLAFTKLKTSKSVVIFCIARTTPAQRIKLELNLKKKQLPIFFEFGG